MLSYCQEGAAQHKDITITNIMYLTEDDLHM